MLRKPVSSFWIKHRADKISAEFGWRVKSTVHRAAEFSLDRAVSEPAKDIHFFIYGLEFGWRYLQITTDDFARFRTYTEVILLAMKEYKCCSAPDVIVIRKPDPSDDSSDTACVYYLTEDQIITLTDASRALIG
jgi:hypothetical protein